MKYLLVLSAIVVCSNTFSQSLLETLDPQAMNNGLLYMKKYKTIQGSPYLKDDFFTSNITLQSGKVFKDEKLNIDLVEHEILTELNGNLSVLDKKMIKSFTIWGLTGTELYEKFKMDGKSYFGKNLYEGKDFKVFDLTIKKVVRKVVQNSSYNDSNSNSDYFVSDSFYILLPNEGDLKQIDKSKKAYEDLDHSEELKKYTKKEKLNLKEDADFICLIEFYDSLN